MAGSRPDYEAFLADIEERREERHNVTQAAGPEVQRILSKDGIDTLLYKEHRLMAKRDADFDKLNEELQKAQASLEYKNVSEGDAESQEVLEDLIFNLEHNDWLVRELVDRIPLLELPISMLTVEKQITATIEQYKILEARAKKHDEWREETNKRIEGYIAVGHGVLELAKKVDEKDALLERKEANLELVKKSLTDMTAEVRVIQDRFDLVNAEKEPLKKENSSLVEERAVLKVALDSKVQELKALEHQHEKTYRDEKARAMNEVQALHKEVSNLTEENAKLVAKINEFESARMQDRLLIEEQDKEIGAMKSRQPESESSQPIHPDDITPYIENQRHDTDAHMLLRHILGTSTLPDFRMLNKDQFSDVDTSSIWLERIPGMIREATYDRTLAIDIANRAQQKSGRIAFSEICSVVKNMGNAPQLALNCLHAVVKTRIHEHMDDAACFLHIRIIELLCDHLRIDEASLRTNMTWLLSHLKLPEDKGFIHAYLSWLKTGFEGNSDSCIRRIKRGKGIIGDDCFFTPVGTSLVLVHEKRVYWYYPDSYRFDHDATADRLALIVRSIDDSLPTTFLFSNENHALLENLFPMAWENAITGNFNESQDLVDEWDEDDGN